MLKKATALLIILIYPVIRVLSDQLVNPISEYLSYVVDLLYGVLVLWCFAHSFNRIAKSLCQKGIVFKDDFALMITCFILGILTHAGSYFFNARFPGAWNEFNFLIQLLIIAPFVEELLFRAVLFVLLDEIFFKKDRRENDAIHKSILKNNVIILISAVLFSWSHFYIYHQVPSLWQRFIIYQGCYAFVLGILLGWQYWKNKNYLRNVILHILFNAGFLVSLMYF